jgi:hypothetical protein
MTGPWLAPTIRRRQAVAAWIMAALACAHLAGCGPARGTPVSGRVTIRAVGPLDRGLIVFADDRILCRGDVGPDGRYRITAGPTGDRVPPGRYKVHFVATGITDEKTREPKPQIAGRFESVGKSDLVVDVPDNPAGVTLDFTVDPPGK